MCGFVGHGAAAGKTKVVLRPKSKLTWTETEVVLRPKRKLNGRYGKPVNGATGTDWNKAHEPRIVMVCAEELRMSAGSIPARTTKDVKDQ